MKASVTRIVCVLGLFISQGQCSADEVLKSRFLAEYPDAALRLRNRHLCVEGTFRIDSMTGNFAINDGNEMFRTKDTIRTRDGSRYIEEVVHLLSNGEYVRIESRLPVPAKSTKALASPEFRVKEMKKSANAGSAYENREGQGIMPALGCRPAYLINLMNFGNFELVDARTVPGSERIEIEIRFGKKMTNSSKVILDPSNDWAVVDLQMRFGNESTPYFRSNVNYGNFAGGLRMPSRVEIRRGSSGGENIDFTSWSRTAPDPRIFSLTSYGLPDLNADRNRTGGNTGRPFLFVVPILAAALLVIVMKVYRTRPN